MNKKGFTLVELLAVIVVLAIIILVAMPAVMSAMDKARKNSLTNEANEIAKIAQTAYADEAMNSSVTGGNAYCYTLGYLKSKGFLEKNDDNYSGAVLLNVKNGKTEYYVFLSNGMYYFDGKESKDLKSTNLTKGKGNKINLEACKKDTGNYPDGFGPEEGNTPVTIKN